MGNRVGLLFGEDVLHERAMARGVGCEDAQLGIQSESENAEKVTPKNLLRLLEQQSYRCAISGMELTPIESSLDHIMPLAKGGKHIISNVQIVVPEINRMKGTMSSDDFVAVCRLVVRKNDGSSRQ